MLFAWRPTRRARAGFCKFSNFVNVLFLFSANKFILFLFSANKCTQMARLTIFFTHKKLSLMTSFWQTCENLKSPITRMTTKFNTRKLISNFILFENLKMNYFFLLSIFHKRTVLRNLVSITATSFCLKFTLAILNLASPPHANPHHPSRCPRAPPSPIKTSFGAPSPIKTRAPPSPIKTYGGGGPGILIVTPCTYLL